MIDKHISSQTLAKAREIWKKESEAIGPNHPAFPYRYNPQRAASARYVVIALYHQNDMDSVPSKYTQADIDRISSNILISRLLAGEIQLIAERARAIFLYQQHGFELQTALMHTSEELGLPTNKRKAANNVMGAARSFMLFFRNLLLPGNAPMEGSVWPTFPAEEHYKDGRVLYNCIRLYHEKSGILNPSRVTDESLRQSVRKYTDRARRQRIANTYNKYLRSLRNALEVGFLAPLTTDFVSTLKPFSFRSDAGKGPLRMSESAIIERFPDVFFPDHENPKRIDLMLGFAGYYNKASKLVENMNGNLCLHAKRLSGTALMTRLHETRAYITRVEERHGLLQSFNAYFDLPMIEEDLQARIANFGYPSLTVRTEYMQHIMVAKTYCAIDVGPLAMKVNRDIRFESSRESTRGEEALEKGGIAEMLLLADGLRTYAEAANKLSNKGAWDKPGAGHYLIRKSAQVDLMIRMDTGLRPGVIDYLELAEERNGRGARPVLWKDDSGCYRVHVPWIWMKQHKADLTANAAAFDRLVKRDKRKRYMKGFSFVLRPETGIAIDEYIEHGWNWAREVKSKETRRFLLNSSGCHMVKDERSLGRGSMLILNCIRESIEFIRRTEGRDLPYFTRYDHRHVVGHCLELHHPGHQLKTTYLTHTSQKGADWYYGTVDNSLMNECLAELFAGQLSRAEQQKKKEAAQEARMEELQRTIAEMSKLLIAKDGKEVERKILSPPV
jgi:hypothetical protein